MIDGRFALVVTDFFVIDEPLAQTVLGSPCANEVVFRSCSPVDPASVITLFNTRPHFIAHAMCGDIEVLVDNAFVSAEHAFHSGFKHIFRNHAEKLLEPSFVNVPGLHGAHCVRVVNLPVLRQILESRLLPRWWLIAALNHFLKLLAQVCIHGRELDQLRAGEVVFTAAA